MKKIFVFFFLLYSASPALSQEIKIGAIASLTGQAAEQGKNWLNGAKLAEAELQSEGLPVVLKVEDDTTNPAKGVSAFRKLENIDRVQAILGGTWDFLMEALVPLATVSKRPFITMTNPIEIFSKEALSSEYVFTNALSLEATETALRNFIALARPKTAAILAPTFPFTIAHADLAEKLCKIFAVQVLLRKDFSYDDYYQSLKVLAAKTTQAKVDVVFIFTSAQGLDPFLQELYRQKAFPLILTTQHLDAALAATTNKEAYKKSFGVYPRILDPLFREKYRKKFNMEPPVYSAEGYDALMFAARSLHRKLDLSDKDATFEYKGVTGVYTLPAKSRQLGDISATIMTTRNGVFEVAPEFEPSSERGKPD